MPTTTLDLAAVAAARRRQRRNHEALTKDQAFEAKIKKLENENDNLAAQIQVIRKDLQNANLQLANARARLKKKGITDDDKAEGDEPSQGEKPADEQKPAEQTEQTAEQKSE